MLDPPASEAVKENCILMQLMKFLRVADIARIRRRVELDLDRKSPCLPAALCGASTAEEEAAASHASMIARWYRCAPPILRANNGQRLPMGGAVPGAGRGCAGERSMKWESPNGSVKVRHCEFSTGRSLSSGRPKAGAGGPPPLDETDSRRNHTGTSW